LKQGAHFGDFLANAVAIKSIQNYLPKSCPALAPKVLVKLAPGSANLIQIPNPLHIL
jgi:hypothetical protein